MCKVSVVVPVYNVKDFLIECVTSLINQTFKDIEILLIDDGSTDGSETICNDFAENYDFIHVIRKENGGLGSARNVGLDSAIGEYVYFIDSDDSLSKTALETLYNLANEHSLDIVLFSARCFCDDFGIDYNADEYRRTMYLNKVYNGKDLFFKLLSVNEYYASIPIRFYNTSYLKNCNFRFPEHIIHEDEIFGYLSLIYASRAECISDRFYNRRFRTGSIMTSGRAFDSIFGYLFTWQKIILSIKETENLSAVEINSVVDFANSRLGLTMRPYAYSLKYRDRKRVRHELSEIKKLSNNSDVVLFRSRLLRTFVYHPELIRLGTQFYKIKKGLREVKSHKTLHTSLIKLRIGHLFNKKYAVLIGTPTHGNLGDQAIVHAENVMLSKSEHFNGVIEIPSRSYIKYGKRIKKSVSESDAIIIDGGGSMGTLWVHNEYRFRDVITRFPNNSIYILPQSVYFGDEEWEKRVLTDSIDIYSQHKKLTIFCRDKESYLFTKMHFQRNNVFYSPDMVLSLYPQKMNRVRKNRALLCFRDDVESTNDTRKKEKVVSAVKELFDEVSQTSTLVYCKIERKNRLFELEKKWIEFSEAKLVVTDRLHAMIFCALTGTPCIALDNKSKKVSGAYEWIKNLPYILLINSDVEINKAIIEELINCSDKYEFLTEVEKEFVKMKTLIEKQF